MKSIIQLIVILFVLTASMNLYAQNNPIVFGSVQDIDSKELVELVSIYELGNTNLVETDEKGIYRISLEANKKTTLIFTRIGYKEIKKVIKPMPLGVKRNINIFLVQLDDNLEIIIRDSKIQDMGMVREEITEMKLIPSTTGNLESVLPQIALGTYGGSGGELSSQYNVRGGNYDENLIYVNDFEIFKPQLISNSQQEGLSFPNQDLIRDLTFSSGGFESKYGDKMSSVLDVKYKRPEEFKASMAGSFLGGSTHIEGSNKLGPNAYNRLRYLAGVRYKSTRNLLNTQDVSGEYSPSFLDIQTYITYDITRSVQLSWLSNYNSSIFNFVPKERETTTGTFSQGLKFSSYFEGQEKDRFLNSMNGIGITYVPERDKNPMYLKFLGSHYYGAETEAIDIQGAYRLSQIELGFGENAGQEVAVLGTGVQHRYVRNQLYNQTINVEHKGGIEFEHLVNQTSNSNFIQWGAKFQSRSFVDDINEWERLDSAGFSLPINSEELTLFSGIKSENDVTIEEYSLYLQNTYSYFKPNKVELKLNYGLRTSYSSLNKDLLWSPRVKLLYHPIGYSDKISFKLAGGIYYQQPFYREMRRPDGSLNLALKAQKSVHLVGGFIYDFHWKGLSSKPFKLISEVYYKQLSDLVSYDVDNVRIRYSGINDSDGYVTGIDMRLNGELVKGMESWINFSLLQARESIRGVTHLKYNESTNTNEEVKYVPRPSDQLMNLSVFFQDYLPKNENFKVHVAFSFGSGLKYSRIGDGIEFRNANRFKPYHRIDIGFSYHLWNEKKRSLRPKHILRFSKDAWINLEVFNLMDIANVASYTWIRTTDYKEYAIPNYLTGRRINLKLKIEI